MRGTAEAQGLFWDTDVLCEELIEEEGFLATLRRARSTVFTDSDFDRLYPSGRGRPSHPPSVLAALLLAQLFYGVSDREAERRSRLDLSWKAALGLPLNHRGIPHVCLAEFRARLLRAGMEGFLHTKLLEVACQAGVVGTSRAIDSTGIHDSVVTQDTVTLIRQALRRCLHRLQEIDPEGARSVRGRLRRDDYEAQGKPQILWSDPGPEPSSWRRCSATPRTLSRPAGSSPIPSSVPPPCCSPRWLARTSRWKRTREADRRCPSAGGSLPSGSSPWSTPRPATGTDPGSTATTGTRCTCRWTLTPISSPRRRPRMPRHPMARSFPGSSTPIRSKCNRSWPTRPTEAATSGRTWLSAG